MQIKIRLAIKEQNINNLKYQGHLMVVMENSEFLKVKIKNRRGLKTARKSQIFDELMD